MPQIILIYLAIINVATFLLYGIDKWKARRSKCNGVCALKDDLCPVLERARQADVIVLGSPVYYSYPTGVMRAFMERLMFPIGTYMYEKPEGEDNGHQGRHITLFLK